MAETPADVKRDIELTRERISDTLQQLESKTNVMQIVKDHPWPAVGVAFAAGFLLSGSRTDVKAASATLVATRGTRTRVGTVLDDVLANLMGGLSLAFQQRVDSLVDELKVAIGGQQPGQGGARTQGGTQAGSQSQRFADADVTPPRSAATRGDGLAAAGTTGSSESRSALEGNLFDASRSTSAPQGSTGMGALGNASNQQPGGTISSAGSQGTGGKDRAD